MTTKKHWSTETALAQIAKCDFACEAGPLSNNAAWIWLQEAARIGPKFWPGQGVWYEVKAEASGIHMSKWVHYFVVGVKMESSTDSRFWTYDLSNDPPAPWHYGTIKHVGVDGSQLRLENPDDAPAEAALCPPPPQPTT